MLHVLQIHEAAPGVFANLTVPWIGDVKNPCFFDKSRRCRCLPYLSIIGVSKCGTTDLYKKLMMLKCARPYCAMLSVTFAAH